MNTTVALTRRREDRMLAGVCAGIAAYTGLPVTLVRMLFVIATIFMGGTGILFYLTGWLLIPEEGSTTSILHNLIRSQRTS